MTICYCYETIEGTPHKSCNIHVLKKTMFENLYILVTNLLSLSNLSLWYLRMLSIDMATRLKLECTVVSVGQGKSTNVF